MALVTNPLTGELEEDGLPEDPGLAALDASPLPAMDQPAQGPAGGGTVLGTPDNPMVATIAPRPKPPVEIVSQTQTTLPSAAEKEAAAELNVANELVSQAAKNEAGTLQEEAKVQTGLADKKVELLEDQKTRNWELDQEEKREEEAAKTHARSLAEDRARKQIAAGRARADYFKGNFVGEIVAALVQSVAAGLHAVAGKDGLSPAERIFEKKYQDHEKALIAEYESSKQAEDHFRSDRPRWEAERAARRAKAAQDALHDVNMAIAVADRSLAKLGPDKVANAAAMKEALRRQADAKFEMEFSKGLREIRKYEKTSRPMGDGTGTQAGEPPWSAKPMGREEKQAYGYGKTIIDSMERSGHIPLARDTIKKFQSNMRQLQKEPSGIVTNWLRQMDVHPMPDDFFTGITDPKQRQAMRDWANAANAQIRQESGAAIPTFEQLNNAYRNIPTTDSPPQEQKRLRDDMLGVGLSVLPRKLEAKPIYDKAVATQQKFAEGKSAPKPERKKGDRARDPRDGSIHEWNGTKWVKVK